MSWRHLADRRFDDRHMADRHFPDTVMTDHLVERRHTVCRQNAIRPNDSWNKRRGAEESAFYTLQLRVVNLIFKKYLR